MMVLKETYRVVTVLQEIVFTHVMQWYTNKV